MNGFERIRAVLAGEWPDRRPVMLHNFMTAAREAGVPMGRYRREPEAIARALIESVEKYGLDGVLVDVDTATLAGAVGVPVLYPDDEPAICHGCLLENLEDVETLPEPNVGAHAGIQVWLEAVRLLKRHFGGEVWIRGNCDQAPFALAALMRGMEAWLLDLMDPDRAAAVGRVLELACSATVQFLKLMAETGADMLSNGDSAAGTSVISPRLYREFALPYERRTAAAAHSLGLPWALHVCGRTDPILCDLASTGADALELDYKTDVRRAHDALRNSVFIGNIDPSGVIARGTPANIEAKTRELLAVFEDTPRLIVNAGCALPADTPEENLRALVRAAHAA